eukprot:c25511_g1_i1 orf=79-3486(-)
MLRSVFAVSGCRESSMEKVQGLQYRSKDGPTMQFWPIHQHDFFQPQPRNIAAQSAHLDARSSFNLPDESGNLQHVPLSWDHFAQLEERNLDASGVKNWSHDWEWDSLRLSGQATTNGDKSNAHGGGDLQWRVQEAEFSSPSPPDNFEENAAPSEPTLLELGLNTRSRATNEDDGLLDLKLGGNGHSIGAGEVSPSSKRSRHSPPENQQTRCQVDNCTADLQNAKDYHRRHKVCEFHAKAPKALVASLMQRFCQQCSRFHLLKEFDEDRRSCRKRLAGHNRRRRKTQPDTATALACLLADQGALSRIISASGQQQGKDELEKLLQERALVQTLLNARVAVGNTAVESASANDLMSAISKSQLLSNLLLSNTTINLPVASAPPADALISALSNALLSSLPQLQQRVNGDVGHGGSIPTRETGQPQEPYTNALGSDAVTKQNTYPRYSIEEQPGSLAFPSSMERPQLLPTTPSVYSDKSNSSNGDSMDERAHFDSSHRGSREGFMQQDRRHWKDRNKGTAVVRSAGNFQTVGAMQSKNSTYVPPDPHTSPSGDRFETTGGLSDHSSDSGLDKQQEQTGMLWFKIFDKNPADIPLSLRNQILEWLDHLPTDMEGHIKPGCIILTVFVCMPVYAWEKLCRNIEGSLHKLVSVSDGDFWHKGRVLAHFGEASAYIIDGKVFPYKNFQPLRIPSLVLVQPFAVVMGETVDLSVRGHNLKAPGTKVICAYEGKCTYKEMDSFFDAREKKRDREEASGVSLAGADVEQEQVVTFNVGPFNNIGRSFIEVEGQMRKGNAFPIIIADKPICEEINSLEKKYVGSGENDEHAARLSSSTIEADITHFLHELGWLLQRVQRKVHYIDLKIPEFSIARYRWLLRFSVEHSCCALVRRILDLLFSTDDSSVAHAHLRAREVLSEANLLHVAVKSKSRAMVEFLLAYSPPIAPTSMASKRECYFRPDTPISDGFTPLHVAASIHSADSVVDALTNASEELWAIAWTSAKDSFGKTPLMYALASGNNGYVNMVQGKLQKLGKLNAFEKEAIIKLPHVALNIGGEDVKSGISSPRKAKQLQHCSCKARENRLTQNLPLQIRGLNKGLVYRPFVLSMLAVAAVCVCVGVLMRGSPSVNCMQGPFVWESISFGPI